MKLSVTQSLSVTFKRMFRWEFWPMGLFYIPVGVYFVFLWIKHRGLSFTAVNPGMPGSGVIGERKSDALLALFESMPNHTAKTELILSNASQAEKKNQLIRLANDFGYPLVLKPDFGQRGIDVKIATNESFALEYLASARFDTVVQPYVSGVEFGVFYIRQPDQPSGYIFSTTSKMFPEVLGDGLSTVAQLIYNHDRLSYQSVYLLKALSQQRLNAIPAKGESVQVVDIGSHCRGSLFLDGKQYLTEYVESNIEALSQSQNEFYFGRYDLRADSIEAFKKGEFKVIEVNGVTSEPTHIYDPKYTLLYAYKTLFKQWRLAFSIGSINRLKGHHVMSLFELLQKLKIMNKEQNEV